MLLLVPRDVPCTSGSISAAFNRARERFFPSVFALMSCQVRPLRRRVCTTLRIHNQTMREVERHPAIINSLGRFGARHLKEAKGARFAYRPIAFEGFFPSVGPEVAMQMTRARRAVSAPLIRALVRLVAGVRPHVLAKVALASRRVLAALHLALEWAFLRQDCQGTRFRPTSRSCRLYRAHLDARQPRDLGRAQRIAAAAAAAAAAGSGGRGGWCFV